MAAPSKQDWGRIHAKAWTDKDFRKLLETDPKAAIAQYGREVGKSFDKIVTLRKKPTKVESKDLQKHPDATFPPACC
jgi:hypothetical protein